MGWVRFYFSRCWRFSMRDYYELTKPRVVFLMIITAWVGMALASPGWIPLWQFLWGTLGIALSAGGAAVVNHLVEQKIDQRMQRTQNRPVASGRISVIKAAWFAGGIGSLGFVILYWGTNPLTAWLTLLSQLAYAFVYTLFLKHATPQNIVIGGIAGAMPPLLGWTAITGQIDPHSLLLVLIIFAWTPPHFWALAIHRHQEYKASGLPMLPVTHGLAFTRLHIVLYTCLMIATTWLPFATHLSGLPYFVGVNVINAIFLIQVIHLYNSKKEAVALKTFYHSIGYLLVLFLLLLGDHYL